MAEPAIEEVALVGVGVIGRGWLQVFSGAGLRTRMFDPDPDQAAKALAWFEEALDQDVKDGFITASEAKKRRGLISAHSVLEDALGQAAYIQESGPERLEVKQSIFAQIDRAAGGKAIIASSTSSLDINQIAAGLEGVSRCLMAHPYNPPHVTPAVEILPTRETDPAITERAVDFLKSVGQEPLVMNFYVPGFLGNRIQAAVVREAIHLVNSGVAGVSAVDGVMQHGLGLRWALMGSFGVNNTNADGGVREYYTRYGEVYKTLMNALEASPPSFDAKMIELIAQGVEAMEGRAGVGQVCRWRDRLIRKIRRLKEEDPHP